MIGDFIKVTEQYPDGQERVGLIIGSLTETSLDSSWDVPNCNAETWKALCQGQLINVYEINVKGETKYFTAGAYMVYKLSHWLKKEVVRPRQRLGDRRQRREIYYK